MTTLLLITGFLGSGKTSVINSLLELLKEKKVGLIINDFGPLVVDEDLLDSNSIVSTKSLAGGQLFCSCLSGNFVDSIEAMLPLGPDYIVVETSGLAKPSLMLEIISVILERSKGALRYGAMIGIVDAKRYPILKEALNVVEEQLIFSDLFIINKSDLVSETELNQLKEEISSLRGDSPLFTTTYGRVDSTIVPLIDRSTDLREKESINISHYKGWGVEGRPKSLFFTFDKVPEREELTKFVEAIAPHMLRIKGFLAQSDTSYYYVDAVGPQITISLVEPKHKPKEGVVCLYSPLLDGQNLLEKEWASNKAQLSVKL